MKLPTEISFKLLLKILLYYQCKINNTVYAPCILGTCLVDFNALDMLDDEAPAISITRKNNCTVELVSPTSIKVFADDGKEYVLTVIKEDGGEIENIMDIPEIQRN